MHCTFVSSVIKLQQQLEISKLISRHLISKKLILDEGEVAESEGGKSASIYQN